MRSDTERNRRRLIKAAAYLVAHRGSSVRMTDVAERAEVSPATAYRHFGSVDEILSQFRSTSASACARSARRASGTASRNSKPSASSGSVSS